MAHLAELDTRRLYLAQGYGSLFSYCTQALLLAEHAAYNRIEAARASRKFPAILERLVDGSVNLSTVRLLAPYLTPENCDEVLAEAAGKSKRDVEVLVARLAPRPDESPSIRRLPPVPHARASAPTDAAGAGIQSQSGIPGCAGARGCSEIDRCSVTEGRASSCGAGQPSEVRVVSGSLSESTACPTKPDLGPTVDGPCAMAANRPLVTPLSPERYRVQFTVGRETHERLGRAQDLLRREIPDGDPGEIFDRALGLLLEDVARKKLAATSNPRPARTPAAGSRHIPARLKRAVWLRDGGRCAFVARSGRRCQEHAFLEFHHIDPYAIGGETTLVNLSLRCRAHNVHEAERLFGSFVPAVSREGRDAGRRLGSSTRPGASDAGQALRARGGAQALLSQTPGP
ncbi:MAG TPA: HNH endonuclease signature motif containing protein [Vicinamibacteria bacterium]|nr:HNH endonuclease signature motif containing protein [Vicinamibacteria bacterium]